MLDCLYWNGIELNISTSATPLQLMIHVHSVVQTRYCLLQNANCSHLQFSYRCHRILPQQELCSHDMLPKILKTYMYFHVQDLAS